MTPLHNACASNNNSSLLVLQKRDNKSSSVSLLLLSSLNGCFNTIQTLLKLYPNSLLQKSDDLFDCKDPNGNTQGKTIITSYQLRNNKVGCVVRSVRRLRLIHGEFG